MKYLLCGLLVFLGAAAFSAAEGITDESRKSKEAVDMSYAFGMVVAGDLAGTGLEFNYSAFTRGLRAVMEREKTRYTMDEAMDIIQTAFAAAQEERGEQNRIEGAAFLAENGRRSGIITTPSGLQYENIAEGTGEIPGIHDTVLVNYRGTTIDGIVFDTTFDDNPVELPMNNVIPGWLEGLRMMKEGGRAKLYIPSNLAYGPNGAGGAIGPNAVLVFDVELITVIKPGQE